MTISYKFLTSIDTICVHDIDTKIINNQLGTANYSRIQPVLHLRIIKKNVCKNIFTLLFILLKFRNAIKFWK